MIASAIGLLMLTMAPPQTPCEGLKLLVLPNVTIGSAAFVPAGAPTDSGRGGRGGLPLPAHCRVAATLTPTADSHIEMELWMPAENWNGKFLAVGNGGWAGNIETGALAAALSRGYAAASNDTGHRSTDAPGGSFVVGHPERLVDFAYRAMHEMTVQAKAMIQSFFKRAPTLSYFQGCSTGGRQGLMEAQRYPEDFDAIIAGAPVYNQIHLNTSQASLQVDLLRNPSGILPPAKVTMLAKAVVSACDANDGVTDGIISNPSSCRFDPGVLKCSATDAADCLTDAQVDAVKRAYAPVVSKAGVTVYPGHPFGFESGWRLPAAGGSINPLMGDMPRFVAHKDANWNPMSFDLDADLALAIKNAAFLEANDPNLNAFKARGGKLLLYHGAADPGPAPQNTINYYSAAAKAVGGSADDWMRVFLMPGVGHCSGGVGPDQADLLGALERWREQGIAPARIVASRGAGRGGQTPMSRPLCPYPQVAAYSGSGSTDDAQNFTCVAPSAIK